LATVEATFPDARGVYYHTDAITFPEERGYGTANGSSRLVKEVESFETRKDREEIVLESMLGHLRELCGASLDYEQLRMLVEAFPDRAPIPPY
jgi:hypothetical protein